MRRFMWVAGAVVCLLIGCSVAFAQTDPRIGTWKLNLTESKVPPNERAPRSDTRTYEATPDGTKMTWVVVDAKGVSHTITYTAKLDGKDYPASGAPNFDTVAFRLLNPKTLEMTLKKAGVVVVGPATVEVSQDGMRMTQTIPTGTAVFDRVK